MEIQQKELMKIIKHYRIHNKVSFIGFHAVDPDTTWYFFRAENDDFISWKRQIMSYGYVVMENRLSICKQIIMRIFPTHLR